MPNYSKLAAFLNSFDVLDPGYDAVSFIKEKIAQDLQDSNTINNGDEEDLQDNDITMSTPEQQDNENIEGKEMEGAFKELEALNQIDEEKKKIIKPQEQSTYSAMQTDFPSVSVLGNHPNINKQASLFTLLQKKLKA
jgi:hypothetical protein